MTQSVLLCLLYLLISFPSTTLTQVVDCNTDSECNCPPTEIGETCILSCNEADMCKGKTLNCRPFDACEIKCKASATCSDGTTINAQTATDVTITCQGDDACKVDIDIFCGTGNCRLICDGETSCVDWGYIDTSLSQSFECIGDCPQALQYSLSEPPTEAPSISHPSHPSTVYPTSMPSIAPPTSTAIIDASMTSTHIYPTYSLSHLSSSSVMPLDDITDMPLVCVASVLFLLILCGCCIFCIWIYNKEQQQIRIEFKAKSISSVHIIEAEHGANTKKSYKASIESSDLYNNNNKNDIDDDEGPVPTHIKIQTVDIVSHCCLMRRNENIPKIEAPNKALPDLPPPRSIPTPLSPWSSPPQTPIPNDVYHLCHNGMAMEPGAMDVIRHHRQYASLPTVPSLPSCTKELQELSTSSVTDMNVNNMRVSMVSCMLLEEDESHEQHSDEFEEHSESIEYQSHHRRTYESYDIGQRSIATPIKLHDIIDTQQASIPRDHKSISKSFESLSETETSVSKHSL